MSEVMQGTCRFCGQHCLVEHTSEDMTQLDIDNQATLECDCDGAAKEREINAAIADGKEAICTVVRKKNKAAGEVLLKALEPLVRGRLKKVSINIDGETTASLFKSQKTVIAETRQTVIEQSDGTFAKDE